MVAFFHGQPRQTCLHVGSDAEVCLLHVLHRVRFALATISHVLVSSVRIEKGIQIHTRRCSERAEASDSAPTKLSNENEDGYAPTLECLITQLNSSRG